MTREWKPGDVAVNASHGYRGIFVKHCTKHNASSPSHWHNESGEYDSAEDFRRPLVVIDPEDEGQVDSLREALADAQSFGEFAAALREYANPKPPRIDEPQGLGAVVEDDGEVWVRTEPQGAGWCPSGGTGSQEYRCWADFSTAARVLSPGVEVDQ